MLSAVAWLVSFDRMKSFSSRAKANKPSILPRGATSKRRMSDVWSSNIKSITDNDRFYDDITQKQVSPLKKCIQTNLQDQFKTIC